MVEVYKSLYVGNEIDYETEVKGQNDWQVVHACKEPYHRQTLGYKGRGAPKEHPEYLFAKRDNRLIMNLVDANDPNFFSKDLIDEALSFIKTGLGSSQKVLVHCNQGESRGPSIALLYLATKGLIPTDSLEAAEAAFKTLYSGYNPKPGIRGFLQQHWNDYT